MCASAQRLRCCILCAFFGNRTDEGDAERPQKMQAVYFVAGFFSYSLVFVRAAPVFCFAARCCKSVGHLLETI